jgi:ribosomal protein L12E/L44/L45/RPP1/RPP2
LCFTALFISVSTSSSSSSLSSLSGTAAAAAAAAADVVLSIFRFFVVPLGKVLVAALSDFLSGAVDSDFFLVPAALLTSMTVAKCVSFSQGNKEEEEDDEDDDEEEEDDDDDDDDEEEEVAAAGFGSGCSALESKPLIPKMIPGSIENVLSKGKYL